MKQFLIRRLLHNIIVLIGVMAIVFFVVYLIGDPVALMLPPEATLADREILREALRLDDPLVVQFFHFVGQALRGDLGTSFRHGVPALPLALSRLPATLELTVVAVLFSSIVGIPIGVYSAIKRNSLVDHFARIFALFGQSMPVYWSGIMMILLFSVKLNWLPPSGRGELVNLIMPGLTLGFFTTAPLMRLMRSSMLEVLNKDYVRTARAKGLTNKIVIFKHALRNAAIPAITVFGMQIGVMLGGAVLTETIFSWPGMGRFVVQAIYNRDFPTIRASVIVFAVLIIIVNFLTDLSYVFLNPQIRYD
ncbi:MAG: ABC transporter permease [Bacillota bacterium]